MFVRVFQHDPKKTTGGLVTAILHCASGFRRKLPGITYLNQNDCFLFSLLKNGNDACNWNEFTMSSGLLIVISHSEQQSGSFPYIAPGTQYDTAAVTP